MRKKKIAVAVGGASGSLYAKVLLDKISDLSDQLEEVGMVMSDNARLTWELELGEKSFEKYSFKIYDKMDFFAPFASGSAGYDALIVCPCSMGVLGRIASGISNDLTTRAADVMLKERRKLILMIRETPYNLIHIKNMMTVTEAGGIICPASPSFYSRPDNFETLAATVVDRAIELAGLKIKTYRWPKEEG